MSFLHPTAPLNSCHRNNDPIDLLDWQKRNETIAPKLDPITTSSLWRDFFQWKRIKEDVIHFTPFDNLPQDQRDAIRARRLRAFKESHIPWIISDFTELAQAIDDVDDMAKSVKFVTDYAVKPVAAAVKRLRGTPFDGPESVLDDMRRVCAINADARARKLALLRTLEQHAGGPLTAAFLALLFPAWKFAALGLQFLQTLDSFFGVGIQLGPLIGLAEETLFRGLHDAGLPFGPDNNKYNQILASRVTRRSAFLAGAHQALHPEDRLTMLAAQHQASTGDYMRYVVIPPEDYPDASQLFIHPWDQLKNYENLAESLPYNLAASAVNNLIVPMFENWSVATTNQPAPEPEKHVPNSLERRVIGLTAQDICPGFNCNTTIFQHFAIENTAAQRLDPITDQLLDALHFFKRLLWTTPALPPSPIHPGVDIA